MVGASSVPCKGTVGACDGLILPGRSGYLPAASAALAASAIVLLALWWPEDACRKPMKEGEKGITLRQCYVSSLRYNFLNDVTKRRLLKVVIK